MTNSEKAEKIVSTYVPIMKTKEFTIDVTIRENLQAAITSQLDEAVREAHYTLAKTQALVMGESVMLGGKIITNEELYKHPTDYVKQAFAEGFAAAREKAAGIASQPMTYEDWCKYDGENNIADHIRALRPEK